MYAKNENPTVFLSNNGGMLNVQGGIKSDKAMAYLTAYTGFYSAMTGGWVAYGGAPLYTYPAYYQTLDGKVHLTGLMKGGANGAFYTMPTLLKPTAKKAFNVNCGNGYQSGYLTIDTSGVMSIFVPSGANGWVVLDGISWNTI
jgi:hypothetical protein